MPPVHHCPLPPFDASRWRLAAFECSRGRRPPTPQARGNYGGLRPRPGRIRRAHLPARADPRALHAAAQALEPAGHDAVGVVAHAAGLGVGHELETRENRGSGLLLGKAWMDPGERTNAWSFEADDAAIGPGDHHYGEVDEFYYVLSGTFRLSWARGDGGDAGSAEFGPGGAVHLPPGLRYQLENIGAEPGAFIYGMAPAPR